MSAVCSPLTFCAWEVLEKYLKELTELSCGSKQSRSFPNFSSHNSKSSTRTIAGLLICLRNRSKCIGWVWTVWSRDAPQCFTYLGLPSQSNRWTEFWWNLGYRICRGNAFSLGIKGEPVWFQIWFSSIVQSVLVGRIVGEELLDSPILQVVMG